jgi:hypothetical protein
VNREKKNLENRRREVMSSRLSFWVVFVCIFAISTSALNASFTMSYGVFDVTFFNDGDSDGYATGEGNWTPEQMSDVGASIATWQSGIGNTAGRQITMHAFWSNMAGNTLGGSASHRYANGSTAWQMGEYVWKNGGDIGPFSYGFDTIIRYDIDAAGVSGGWNFGSDAAAGNQIDFRSVVTHEIGHSLGWSATYSYISDIWGDLGSTTGLTAWDENLVDSAGNRPEVNGYGTPGNFNELDSPVYFDGANAVAVYGSAVPIYAPGPFQVGSSLAHIDEGTFGTMLMTPSFAIGQTMREVSDLEWAIMEDMGWTVIPEPATILLFGLSAIFIRKRK